MGEENYPNLEKICRLCLYNGDQVKPLIDIFPNSNVSNDDVEVQLSIPMRIMACAALEVQSNDGMPKSICVDCRYQLEKSYYFRKRSQLSDSKLRKHIRLLSLGKKSRVFDKTDEEDDDELEFVDSIRFLREKDELKEKEQSAVWKEKLHAELQQKIIDFKEQWIKEYKEVLRAEVAEELRPAIATELRKSLRPEVELELREVLREECTEIAKFELRQEVLEECRLLERNELLNELESYLKEKRCGSDTIITKSTILEETIKIKAVPSQQSHINPINNGAKRRGCSLSSMAKKSKIQRIEVSSSEVTAGAVHNSEIQENNSSCMPFEAVTLISSGDNGDDTEGDQDFYIVETENDNNDETEDTVDQHSESQDSGARIEYYEGRIEGENFHLQASEKTNHDPGSESYHIEDTGEIQYYKKNEESTIEDDRSNEPPNENDDDEDVIVFNFEEGLDSDQVDSMQLMSLAKKIIVVKANEKSENDEEKKDEKPLFTKRIDGSGSALIDTGNNTDVLPARNTDTPKTFKCNLCPMVFSTENSLNRHLRTHRKMEQRGVAYQCPECLIFVSCKSALNRHMVLHTGARPHVCEECGKSFVQREILKRHMQTHSKIKPHKCPHCARTFTQKNSLTHHFNRTHMEVPMVQQFACHLCSKRFNHASGLSRHLVTHTGLTFQCTKCKRKFADRSSIKRHIANVHGMGKETSTKSASELQQSEENSSGKNGEAKFVM